jgi:hypothetical protein
MNLHRLLVRALAALLPESTRSRYREQWLADLRDCAELGIPARQITLGALSFAIRRRPGDPTVHRPLPIGPLAIALRRAGAGSRSFAVVAAAALLMLALGVGLLLL